MDNLIGARLQFDLNSAPYSRRILNFNPSIEGRLDRLEADIYTNAARKLAQAILRLPEIMVSESLRGVIFVGIPDDQYDEGGSLSPAVNSLIVTLSDNNIQASS